MPAVKVLIRGAGFAVVLKKLAQDAKRAVEIMLLLGRHLAAKCSLERTFEFQEFLQ